MSDRESARPDGSTSIEAPENDELRAGSPDTGAEPSVGGTVADAIRAANRRRDTGS
ncbi:hypothetical protein GCM10023192_19060 [Amycolatopsis samaneae]